MRETVLVSLCMLGIPCRYHGQKYRMGHRIGRPKKLMALMDKYNVLPLCGEQLGGLTTPRPPCKVVGDRVITKDETLDVTCEYTKGADIILEMCVIHNIESAYLLKDSPMCDKEKGVLGRLLRENNIKVMNV